MCCAEQARFAAIARGAVEEVLRLKCPDLEAQLIDLGATSLDAIELIMTLEERLSVDLPMDTVSLTCTTQQIAERLFARSEGAEKASAKDEPARATEGLSRATDARD